jgi:hypothetical protein
MPLFLRMGRRREAETHCTSPAVQAYSQQRLVAPLNTNRKLIYLILIPLAIYLGWVLSEPMSRGAKLVVGGLFGLLLIPILLRWHQPLLFFSWNASMWVGFLPGNPPWWMTIGAAAFLILLLQWIIEKKAPLLTVRSINWALGVILVVTLITAWYRGGIGLRAMGSESYGGKRYIYIFAAIISFYALSFLRVPPERVRHYVAYYFLGGLTHIIPNLIAFAGPAFYIGFVLFSYDYAVPQIQTQFLGGDILRLGGFALAMQFTFFYLLARFPIREFFSMNRLWLPFLTLAVVVIATLGGFRSSLILMALVFGVKFSLDRLLFTRLFFALLLAGVLMTAAMIPVVDKLPFSIQRTMSFIPFMPVDPLVRMDAFASTDWRLQMWAVLMEDLPKYLLIGKGYVIDPTDMYMVEHSMLRGFVTNYEAALVAGDYHSGPLSVLMNFGIPGALAWLAFCVISLRALIRNFRYGEERWRNYNGLILALYITKLILFFLIFGDFATQLYEFTGLLGLSLALNGGVREKPATPRPVVKVPTLDVRRFEHEPVLARRAS